ncbi:MAG: ribosome silencing factor [Planctomycetes bacterium]|nr:ribosome silencing factor [Planctomycetota bacterium]
MLDVSEVSPITEFFVLATGDNARHVKALAEEAIRAIREEGASPDSREGLEQGAWAVVDYGPLMIHVFGREQRAFYDLEMLWGDGAKVRWKAPVRRAKAGGDGAKA